MKTLIYLSALLMLSLFACKKDPVTPPLNEFEAITKQTIADNNANINQNAITYDAAMGTNFKVGSIIFFKTSSSNLGKIEVMDVSANKEVTLHVITFDSNGDKLVDQANFKPLLSKSYDFDQASIPEDSSVNLDFSWYTGNGVYTLGFVANAKGYLFKI